MNFARDQFIQELHDIWDRAEDAVEVSGSVESHLQVEVDRWLGVEDATLADFAEALGRRAHAVLKARAA